MRNLLCRVNIFLYVFSFAGEWSSKFAGGILVLRWKRK